jgi:hypothetical protein
MIVWVPAPGIRGSDMKRGEEDMGEGMDDDTLKGKTSLTDSTLKADSMEVKTFKGRNSGGLFRFTDPDDMNPDEPGILRDPDDNGLIQRYWRRKEIQG